MADINHCQNEETNNGASTQEEVEEEEFVILDLDDVFHGAPLSANCSYTLTGLDTMSPMLTLGNGLKLIGEYVETIGSVIVYSEKDEAKPDAEIDPEAFPTPVDVNVVERTAEKKVQGVCKLEKKLKFRVMQT